MVFFNFKISIEEQSYLTFSTNCRRKFESNLQSTNEKHELLGIFSVQRDITLFCLSSVWLQNKYIFGILLKQLDSVPMPVDV